MTFDDRTRRQMNQRTSKKRNSLVSCVGRLVLFREYTYLFTHRFCITIMSEINEWTIRIDEKQIYVCKCGPGGPAKDSTEYLLFWRQALRLTTAELTTLIGTMNPLFNLNWINLPFPDHAKERLDVLTWLADVDRDETVANGNTVESVYYQQLHVYWSMSEKQREEHGNIVPLKDYRNAAAVHVTQHEEDEDDD
jgi:hypothetical protein